MTTPVLRVAHDLACFVLTPFAGKPALCTLELPRPSGTQRLFARTPLQPCAETSVRALPTTNCVGWRRCALFWLH